jgi:hypothetical protein
MYYFINAIIREKEKNEKSYQIIKKNKFQFENIIDK